VLKLLRDLAPRERKPLEALLLDKARPDERRDTVVRLIQEREILPWCLRRAAEYVDEAKGCLRGFRESVYTENLALLADFVVDRRT